MFLFERWKRVLLRLGITAPPTGEDGSAATRIPAIRHGFLAISIQRNRFVSQRQETQIVQSELTLRDFLP